MVLCYLSAVPPDSPLMDRDSVFVHEAVVPRRRHRHGGDAAVAVDRAQDRRVAERGRGRRPIAGSRCGRPCAQNTALSACMRCHPAAEDDAPERWQQFRASAIKTNGTHTRMRGKRPHATRTECKPGSERGTIRSNTPGSPSVISCTFQVHFIEHVRQAVRSDRLVFEQSDTIVVQAIRVRRFHCVNVNIHVDDLLCICMPSLPW